MISLSLSGDALRLALNPPPGSAATDDPVLLDGVSPDGAPFLHSTTNPPLINVSFSLTTPSGKQAQTLSVSPRNAASLENGA